jgi:multimeric flavodoxin WrbA
MEMKNILVVVGSGVKNSNTNKLADAYIKGAQEKGHLVNKLFLGDKYIQGCKGCRCCQRNGNQCILNDDMQDMYALFNQSDIIVLASPLYFWTITASIKAFIERLYAISTDDLYPKKETYLLMTSDDDQFWTFEQPISYYRFLTKALGWCDKGMCLARGCHGGLNKLDVSDQYLSESYQLGKMT